MGRWAWLGVIISDIIIIPVIVYFINSVRGNNGEKYTDVYIRNSFSKDFVIEDEIIFDYTVYTSKLQRRNNSKGMYYYTFYSKQYNKYYKFIIFEGIDTDPKNRHFDYNSIRKEGLTRLSFNNKSIKLNCMINKTQENDPQCGTKEKPIPILKIDLISKSEEYVKTIKINDDVYKKSVNEYLTFFMTKEEFKEMFLKK